MTSAVTVPPIRSHTREESMMAAETESSVAAEVAELSYEQAREQLVTVVSQLEAGGTSLEESLALWESGEALANRCEAWLEGAKQRLESARERQHGPGAEDSAAGGTDGDEAGAGEA